MEVCWRELTVVKVKKVNSTNGPLEQPRKVGEMCSREESAYLFYKAGSTGWNQHKHLVGNKDAVSHSSCPVQSLYTRNQQLDTMSRIKNSYIKSHQKLTLAFPFRGELLGKYGQSDHFNKQDKGRSKKLMMNWDSAARGGGGKGGGSNCYHSYHSNVFHDTYGRIQSCREMTKAEITQARWTEGKKPVLRVSMGRKGRRKWRNKDQDRHDKKERNTKVKKESGREGVRKKRKSKKREWKMSCSYLTASVI